MDVTIVKRSVLYNQKANGRGLLKNLHCACVLPTPCRIFGLPMPENFYLLSFGSLIKDQHSSLGFEMHGDIFILQGGMPYKEAKNSEEVGLLKQYPEYYSWWLFSLVASHTWFPEAFPNRPAPGRSRSLFVGNGCQNQFSEMTLL